MRFLLSLFMFVLLSFSASAADNNQNGLFGWFKKTAAQASDFAVKAYERVREEAPKITDKVVQEAENAWHHVSNHPKVQETVQWGKASADDLLARIRNMIHQPAAPVQTPMLEPSAAAPLFDHTEVIMVAPIEVAGEPAAEHVTTQPETPLAAVEEFFPGLDAEYTASLSGDYTLRIAKPLSDEQLVQLTHEIESGEFDQLTSLSLMSRLGEGYGDKVQAFLHALVRLQKLTALEIHGNSFGDAETMALYGSLLGMPHLKIGQINCTGNAGN